MRLFRCLIPLATLAVFPLLLGATPPPKKPKAPKNKVTTQPVVRRPVVRQKPLARAPKPRQERVKVRVSVPSRTASAVRSKRRIKLRISGQWEHWQQTYNAIQTALITAPSGSIVQLPAGKFHIYRGLSIGKRGITLRGMGMDKTILTFDNQLEAAQALSITADHVTVEDLTIQNASGDGVKAVRASHLTLRRVKVWWVDAKGKPMAKTSNGSYGFYPVQCKHVLIEHCVAMGGSDSGIYIGQSDHVVLRHNTAKMNVAGIEVENSQNVDVYNNLAENNAGGILLFRLPLLPKQYGKNVRVFNNKIIQNNHPNFAPTGATVRMVPSGTGMMIVANNQVHIFKNQFSGNRAFAIVLSHFALTGRPMPPGTCCKPECTGLCGDVCPVACRITDTPQCQSFKGPWTKYNPCATGIDIRNNTFQTVCGTSEDPTAMIATLVAPEILFGGFVDVSTLPANEKICIGKGQKIPAKPKGCISSGQLNTVDLDMRALATGKAPKPVFGLAPYQCTLPPLPPAKLK